MGRTSSKRDEILRFLTKFTAENGYAPSVREICAAYDFARFIGISSGSATHSGRATTLWSYGGIVTFDMRLVRMPKNDTSLGVYVYKPSDRNGVVTGVNLSLPL